MDNRGDCEDCPRDNFCIQRDEVNKFRCNRDAFDYSEVGFALSCKDRMSHNIEGNVQKGINNALLVAMNLGRFLLGTGQNATNVTEAIKAAMTHEVGALVRNLKQQLDNQTVIDETISDMVGTVILKFNNTAERLRNIKAYSSRLKEWIDAELEGARPNNHTYIDSFYGLTWNFPAEFRLPENNFQPAELPTDFRRDAGLGSLASLKALPMYACKQARFVKLYTNTEDSQ